MSDKRRGVYLIDSGVNCRKTLKPMCKIGMERVAHFHGSRAKELRAKSCLPTFEELDFIEVAKGQVRKTETLIQSVCVDHRVFSGKGQGKEYFYLCPELLAAWRDCKNMIEACYTKTPHHLRSQRIFLDAKELYEGWKVIREIHSETYRREKAEKAAFYESIKHKGAEQ